MRFNDLLRTVLANAGDGSVATVTRWRQCVDLLAQYDISGAQAANALNDDIRDTVLSHIDQIRTQLSVEQRVTSVVELGSRLRSPGLVRLLSQDHPSLVSAMMSHVRLIDQDWASIIPDLGPLARSVLRRRTDLGQAARAALQQFGSTDLTLTSLVPVSEPEAIRTVQAVPHVAANDGDEVAPSQIGRIVAQIERFKDARQHRPDEELGLASASHPIDDARPIVEQSPINSFSFETDAAGIFRLVSGAPRGAIAGLTIGSAAIDRRYGADGLALGAFRRRAAFEKARFTIGEGLLEGEWRISAEPRFDRASGRFLNYVGTARRELPHEAMIKVTAEAQGWAGMSAGSTRQLIHELRTPLNAIHGYAEMIEAELLGPVTLEYRDMARQILTDARSLVATFDDLDLASRIERGDHLGVAERIDPEQTLRSVISSFDNGSHSRIDLHAEDELPMIGGDKVQMERMLSHLLRAGCAALKEHERLTIVLKQNAAANMVHIVMTRPVALLDVTDDALLDHGYLVDQKLRDAPPLGLAFAFKLVRGLAIHLGGRFDIMPDSFGIVLPASVSDEEEQEKLL